MMMMMASSSLNIAPSVNRHQFISRFLGTEVSNGTVNLAPVEHDKVELSESRPVSQDMALATAVKIQELGSQGMWGALPVLVSAALLKTGWQGDSPPSDSPPKPGPDEALSAQLPQGFTERELARQKRVVQRLNQVGGQHKVEYLLTRTDPPASAAGGEVWMNLPVAAQVFPSDSLLAFAVAHEKGHINNDDVTWEPTGTGVLWEVMTQAYDKAEAAGNLEAAAKLDAGIAALQRSFDANARLNEVEADLAAIEMLEAAGYDRKPGLAFLLTTAGDSHHPPGSHRVAAIRQHLQGTQSAIGEEEMNEILEMAKNRTFVT